MTDWTNEQTIKHEWMNSKWNNELTNEMIHDPICKALLQSKATSRNRGINELKWTKDTWMNKITDKQTKKVWRNAWMDTK